MNSSTKGFTLIELLVTIGIVGILISIALGFFNMYKTTANNTNGQAYVRNLVTASESYLFNDLPVNLLGSIGWLMRANETHVYAGVNPAGAYATDLKQKVFQYMGMRDGSVDKNLFSYIVLDLDCLNGGNCFRIMSGTLVGRRVSGGHCNSHSNSAIAINHMWDFAAGDVDSSYTQTEFSKTSRGCPTT